VAGDTDKEQRTERATDKRREETFRKGRTPHSREVSSTFVLIAAVAALYYTGPEMRVRMMEVMTHGFTTGTTFDLNVETVRPLLLGYLRLMWSILAPLMATILVAGVLASILQNGGFLISLEPLKPQFSKLNPIKGFGRFVSKQALMELMKSLFKVFSVGYLCYWVIKGEWENIPSLSGQGTEQIVWFITWVGLKLLFYVLLLMVMLAVIDFAFQKYQFEENIKMTKQEIKDERKETEGDPMIKQRVRSVQMQIARRRMMSEVPKAEVVITNPTHLAVALAYDRATMDAPAVVAKGAGLIAKRIREIAKEHDVPIIEDKPLARILYKSVDIGKAVPEELFRTIAEILAYVYKLKGKDI